MLPIEYKIKIRKLVYWHKLLNFDETRLVKTIYNEQNRMGLKDCWYSEICNISSELSIHLSETEISNLKEKEWLKIINEKVIEKMNSVNKSEQRTKLRLIKKSSFGFKDYLKDNKLAPKLLSMKLNMIELRANYKGKYPNTKCRRCGIEDETIEHLWTCVKFKKQMPRKKLLQATKTKDLKKIWAWYCSFIES